MPKGKRKDRVRYRKEAQSDDDLEESDATSVLSSQSDTQSLNADGADEVDEAPGQLDFEDHVKDSIEGLSEKSLGTRTASLVSLKRAFSKKMCTELLFDRKCTILDALEKSLKKGKGEEQVLSSQCVVLLCLQLADDSFSFTNVQKLMKTIIIDKSANIKARTACAFSLGMLTFLSNGENEVQDLCDVLNCLEGIFTANYLKPGQTTEMCALHASCLSAWALLLSNAPAFVINDQIDSHQILKNLTKMLDSSGLDVRIAAGETIALIFEIAEPHDDIMDGGDLDELCLKLKELATDSNKYRAKKDRKQQRSSFREILQTVEMSGKPNFCAIKFGVESIVIDSWSAQSQYDALCQALGIGIQVHLQENELVRDIFGLGAPVPTAALKSQTISKRERNHYNAEAFKARTKLRAKHRDKRSAVIS